MEVVSIPIDKVKVVSNHRTDFRGIEELAAGIEETGLLNPITVRKNKSGGYELVAGERRLRAHKHLMRDVIDAHVIDVGAVSVAKLSENVSRDSLSLFEEADGVEDSLRQHKLSVDSLAQKLGKTKQWVERRLAISKLDGNARKEILRNNLSLSHALALAKVQDKESRKSMLKDAVTNGLNARAMVENSQYSFKKISTACFDCSDCKKCKHNGSHQSELFETGKTLSGRCMNPKCFLKKLNDHKKAAKKKYEESCVKAVLMTGDWAKDEELTKDYSQVWVDNRKQKKKILKDPRALIVITISGDETLYFKGNWRELLVPKTEQAALQEEKEKQRLSRRKDILKNKLCGFMFDFYRKKVIEKMRPNTKQSKALTLYVLQNLLRYNYEWRENGIKEMGFNEMLGTTESALDEKIMKASELYLKAMSLENVKLAAMNLGTRLEKDFSITEEFLKLHTKEQLQGIAKEVKTDVKTARKNSEFIEAILKDNNGTVPKSVVKT